MRTSRLATIAALLLIALGSSACAPATSTRAPAQQPSTPAAAPAAPIKHVILLIGDGMGPQQVGLLEEYARHAPTSIYAGRPTAISRMMTAGEVGASRHNPAESIVADSACSASQLASGQPSLSETIGLNADGDPVPTVLEVARDRGMATGLVSDTRITHATPAAFAAHVPHRSMENDIAAQMLANRVDVMLSGGRRHWLPASNPKSRRDDERDLLREAAASGYTVLQDRRGLRDASALPVLGLFATSGMMDAIALNHEHDDADRTEPTLPEMTRRALDLLALHDDGFFLMVEAGQIDWAGHANDAGWMLHEMVKFDQTVDVVLDWASGRDDTLVVLTADHETGGFSFSYTRHDVPAPTDRPGAAFARAPYQPAWNFGTFDQLDGLWVQSATFFQMLARFEEAADPTPDTLAQIINTNSAFNITTDQAREILADEPNHYHVPGHRYLDAETFPAVHDFEAFYPFGEETRANLIGRAMATAQNIAWSTGAHTHTPVPVVALGPADITERFDGLLHHTDIGRILLDVVEAR